MIAIAYLAPEIPARSATFIYREAAALEAIGCAVSYFSVHRPPDPAPGQEAIAARVQVLYHHPVLWRALHSLSWLAAAGLGSAAARAALPGRQLAWRALWQDLAARPTPVLVRLKLIQQWLTAVLLARALRRQGISHLHIHFAHVPATIGTYACLFAQLPCTVVAHANDVHVRASLLPQKAARARWMIAVSEAMRSELRTRGVPDQRIRVLRCGTAMGAAPLASGPEAGPALQAPSPWILGSLGRLVEKKGFADLLRVGAQLRAQGVPLQIRLAGEGPQRSALQALVHELGLEACVRMEGALAPDAVAGWLAQLSCFLLPCRVAADGDVDGIPVVLMEAMAAGIPVVSTRLSGIPELVIDGQTGLLAEAGDVLQLTAAVRRVHEDSTLRARVIAGARSHLRREFDLARNAGQLLALIREAA